MLLNSVIIVVREALEAALMISVLLALSRSLGIRTGWIGVALLAGFLGAVLYGIELQQISDLFDGVGQEVVNASLQFCVFAMLLVCQFLAAQNPGIAPSRSVYLPAFMAAAVAFAVAREGSEILVYVSGFLHSQNFLATVGAGSLIGACIGLSVGVLLYYLLVSQPAGRCRPVAQVLICLVGAGMCAQATALLIQADWLSVAGPVWDTSAWLPESSAIGQLLYALIGYEASPSAPEVGVYLGSMLAMLAAFLLARFVRPESGDSAA